MNLFDNEYEYIYISKKSSLLFLPPMELEIIEIRAYNYFELNPKVKQIDEKDLG